MNNIGFALEGAWRVLLTGLLLGAGLPALFALAIRALAFGRGGEAQTGTTRGGNVVGTIVGYLLLAVILGAIALGITMIVASGFGMKVSFDSIIPTVVKK